MPTAAVVIIGDEILKGKFADENGPFFIERLRALGTELVRLVTIPDTLDGIAEEVRRCAALADFVFTTGGVGPTHDDLTLSGIARAFDVPVVLEPALVELMRSFDIPENPATLRMAQVPEGCELVQSEASSYPVLKMRNVWIFPGVPRLMKVKFNAIADRFKGEAVHTAKVFVTANETDIAEELTRIIQLHPQVEVGSYPRFGEADFRVILTLESRNEPALEACRTELEANLPTR